jgi:hypothetical protein
VEVSIMPTRYSEDWTGTAWNYPRNIDGFLKSLGTSRKDEHEARVRVEFFMVLPVSKKMPPQLRAELIAAGLLDPVRRHAS